MSRNKGSVKAKRERTDREKLELFVKNVDELNNTRLVKKGFSIERKMQGKQGQPLEFELKQPEEADFKDYLMTFRPFISDNEDVFLGRILGICHKRLTDEEVKQNLIQARQGFEKVKLHNGELLIVNGVELSSLQVTDVYLNGRYFHHDLEYQQQLDNMSPLEADTHRFKFLNFVINTSKIITYVRNVIAFSFQEGLFQFEER